MNLDQWAADVNGRTIGNGQCWDLAQDYASRVCGAGNLNTQLSPHPGYAIGVWDGFGQNGVEQWFTQAGPTETALPGWIAIWHWGSPVAPFSHIAPVIKDYGPAAYCMSQNPGPAHYMPIPKLGLAGYLVPKTLGTPLAQTAASVTLADNGIAGQIGDTIGQLQGLASFAANVQHFFSTPGIWTRIGVWVLGGLILAAALVYMFKNQAAAAVKEVAGNV